MTDTADNMVTTTITNLENIIMKYLLTFLMLFTFNAYANPEIGRQVHFVLDANNANHEFKPVAGADCESNVVPNGDGTAWAQANCSAYFVKLPWYNIEAIATDMIVTINGASLPNNPCEIYDYSNNAGNNQGYNVTQYNSNNWSSRYRAKIHYIKIKTIDDDGEESKIKVPRGYDVTFTTICMDGLQQ